MTNAEKFKTAEERAKAFEEFCFGRNCDECTMYLQNGKYSVDVCLAFWLDLEAKDEKALQCPFCGSMSHISSRYVEREGYVILCGCCKYKTPGYESREKAIAEHNRVARAALGVSK